MVQGVDSSKAMDLLKSYFKDESGATAVEYALMVALLGITITVGVRGVGDALNSRFENISEELAKTDVDTSGG